MGGRQVRGVRSLIGTIAVTAVMTAVLVGSGTAVGFDVPNGSVTTAKIANNAVTSVKIANGAVAAIDLSPALQMPTPFRLELSQGQTGQIANVPPLAIKLKCATAMLPYGTETPVLLDVLRLVVVSTAPGWYTTAGFLEGSLPSGTINEIWATGSLSGDFSLAVGETVVFLTPSGTDFVTIYFDVLAFNAVAGSDCVVAGRWYKSS